jgi:hypothetical protein
MGSDKVFIAVCRPLYITTPGELHVLLLPILRKISQIIFFQFSVSHLYDRI